MHARTCRLVQTIDTLKAAAGKQLAAARVERQLQQMAAPKQWTLGDGKVCVGMRVLVVVVVGGGGCVCARGRV